MSNPKVSVCPVMEAVARSMFGIEQVPIKYQKRMVTRAAKEAHKIYSELEQENDELREQRNKYLNILIQSAHANPKMITFSELQEKIINELDEKED